MNRLFKLTAPVLMACSLQASDVPSTFNYQQENTVIPALFAAAQSPSVDTHKQALDFLQNHAHELQTLFHKQVQPIIDSVLANPQVQQCLKRIGKAAFEGALITLTFHTLIACSSGQTTVALASSTAAEAALIGAIDMLLARFHGQSALMRGAITYGTQEIVDHSSQILLGTYVPTLYSRALMTGLVTTLSDAVRQVVDCNGGWATF